MDKIIITTQEKLNRQIEAQVEKALEERQQDYELELSMKQASLATLQAQINPHFLYNTLECIRGMALLADQEPIADIASSLSRFFRYSISGKSDLVTVADEIENVENYIKIQQYRFQDRFSLLVQNDHQADEALLPKLTLQPVVENAILHGLSDITEDGQIAIEVRKASEHVTIKISDNGCGMTPEELEQLCQKIYGQNQDKEKERRHTGIGMQNVDRRLKLHFGQQYGLSLQSCKGMGTDVEVWIPYVLSAKK